MKNTTHFILGLLALASGMEAKAQIQLPSVFSDGMVLQQNSKVPYGDGEIRLKP